MMNVMACHAFAEYWRTQSIVTSLTEMEYTVRYDNIGGEVCRNLD